MPAKYVRSVDRAIDVLLEFTQLPTMGIQDLEVRLGLPKATLYRMLAGLENKGLISSFGDPRRFRLGPKVQALSNAWSRSFSLTSVSEPVLAQLYSATGETIVLYVPHGSTERIVLRQIKSTQPLAYARYEGFISPLAEGAGGRVLLAFFAPERAAAVLHSLPKAAARKQLEAELARVRSDGFAVASGERIPGATSIGAPVLGSDGFALGAVCLLAPESRASGAERKKLVGAVVSAAAQISSAAGYEAPR